MLVHAVITSTRESVCRHFISRRKIYYKPLKQTFFCKASDNNVWFFFNKKAPTPPQYHLNLECFIVIYKKSQIHTLSKTHEPTI